MAGKAASHKNPLANIAILATVDDQTHAAYDHAWAGPRANLCQYNG